MKDKTKLTAIILAILAIIVVIINLLPKEEKENKKSEPIIVSNYSNFYTVNSCLYRVTTYVSAQDKDSLFLLLSDDYKDQNKIKKDNVLDLFFETSESSTFVSEKMFYETLDENLLKFYVKGYVAENQILDDELLSSIDKEYVYFIVYLDFSENIFSVEPYDGEIFKEGDTNEK